MLMILKYTPNRNQQQLALKAFLDQMKKDMYYFYLTENQFNFVFKMAQQIQFVQDYIASNRSTYVWME